MMPQAHTRKSSQITRKRPLKFHPKTSKKRRASILREVSVEPSPDEKLLSEEEIEEEELKDEPMDIQQVTEENQINVFISSAIFSNRQEYIIYYFV